MEMNSNMHKVGTYKVVEHIRRSNNKMNIKAATHKKKTEHYRTNTSTQVLLLQTYLYKFYSCQMKDLFAHYFI